MFLLLSLHFFSKLPFWGWKPVWRRKRGKRRRRREEKEGIGIGGRGGRRFRNPEPWDHSWLLPLTSPVAADMKNVIWAMQNLKMSLVSYRLNIWCTSHTLQHFLFNKIYLVIVNNRTYSISQIFLEELRKSEGLCWSAWAAITNTTDRGA